jgi:hypothetical protein
MIAPITDGNAPFTGEVMTMSSTPWKSATAKMLPRLVLKSQVIRIDPVTIENSQPVTPPTPIEESPLANAKTGRCHTAQAPPMSRDEVSALLRACSRGSAKPLQPTSSPKP